MEEEINTFCLVEVYHGYVIAKGPLGSFAYAVLAPNSRTRFDSGSILSFTYDNVRECKKYIDARRRAMN